MTSALPWLILLLPFFAAAAIILFTKPLPAVSSFISVATVLACFVFSCIVFATPNIQALELTWLDLRPVLFVPLGFVLDELTKTMLVLVTGVGALIHVYSLGYMRDDSGKSRYFASLSFFMFSMLGIVVSNNFVMMFIFWELVGVSSYLLIGHWFERETAAEAAKKAFLTNRRGDSGFMLGIMMAWAATGTVVFSEMNQELGRITSYPGYLTISALLIFCGAIGKSAQFPLHVWLPDSMEGPTPISALIHAATMVTAGIFMVARMSPLYELSETARSVVLVIGAITALSMGLVALTQFDIKRVVAFSTLSQLGYMTAALGASAYSAGIFHLMTHAFFKAVLFLAAGSVIIALHHEQDMRRMGGLRKYMPWTYWTLLVGAISSAGIPGFSGFFSKDAIIAFIGQASVPGAGFAYFCVTACVFVTAAYTFRMVFMAFHGKARFDAAHPPHESPPVVTLPL